MLLSKSCRYALRASIYLAQQPGGAYVSTRNMCSSLDISFHYLIKILQKMNKHKLIQSERGNRGGVRLARPSDQILMKEIIESIESESFLTKCVLGFPACGAPDECALHKEWVVLKTDLNLFFSHTSLYALSVENNLNY
ncbi:MAG: Rrf2 family transcriptional regulator [Balneolales bacterium]